MLALLTIALVASLVMPWALPGRGRAMLEGEAQRVATFLRGERDAALRSGAPSEARLDAAAHALRGGGGVLTLPPRLTLRMNGEVPGRIVFAADGRASAAALRLSAGGASVLVTVRPYTGAVEIAP
ncbi:hypothetical protein [Acuticoccus sp. I52.16.1]|uniref:hypothetical protein n=1 Tax=Acuticoccus sp. I52.16.1 TaxID=2928472 RepID=UPI001FD289A0|nr:hypothetical protein [Acuticoccus sp. I52.16.1]UOM34663.1 hypothetical protein MRB58_00140 [Acuticoccus sp. I52.16.1]